MSDELRVDQARGGEYTAPGSVEGTLGVVESREGRFFGVRESLWGGWVRCEIRESVVVRALEVCDKRVLARGVVSADEAGHPRRITVETIEALPGREQLPQSLMGIDPDFTGGLSASEYTKKRWRGEA